MHGPDEYKIENILFEYKQVDSSSLTMRSTVKDVKKRNLIYLDFGVFRKECVHFFRKIRKRSLTLKT